MVNSGNLSKNEDQFTMTQSKIIFSFPILAPNFNKYKILCTHCSSFFFSGNLLNFFSIFLCLQPVLNLAGFTSVRSLFYSTPYPAVVMAPHVFTGLGSSSLISLPSSPPRHPFILCIGNSVRLQKHISFHIMSFLKALDDVSSVQNEAQVHGQAVQDSS
jgi:hypothetical protein